ncbi:MAG: sulfatase-like hydrolase/transferase [Verrucomicrobiota bacterium]
MTRRPNILWIGMDQIRYDTPACNGNPVCRTPNLDRIAARGVSFDRAYTPSTLCTPARASMLTGQFAFHHGLITNCDLYHAPVAELPRPDELLHHRLHQAGYRCGFVGKSHIGTEKGPRDYGFEGFSPPGYGDIRNQPRYRQHLAEHKLAYTIRDRIYANPDDTTCLAGIWDGPAESTPAAFLAEETMGLLDEYAACSQPFFLTCQFWGPHQAHLPSREFAGMHDREAIAPWPNFADEWQGKPEMVKRVHRDFYRARPSGWEQWREVVGLYYDFTAMIDAQLGRILDRLEALGLADNTIVVFTTDHGDMTGSHGGMIDKGYPYEEAHHIPLIVAWPGQIKGGRRTDAMVYNMDIFPTLLEAAGLNVPELDGQSFLEALHGRETDGGRNQLYLEFHGLRFLYSQRGIITDDNWKYIFTPGDRDEVYDLNTDPAELVNLIDAPDCAERVNGLRQRLMAAAAAAHDPLTPCIWKYFGDWQPPGRQFDATRV